jgi:4-hydroxythreonine-4-phosphate dehydrogenase
MLTPGEPAGIGPDICLQLAQQPVPAELVAVAAPELLRQRAAQLGLTIVLTPWDPSQPARSNQPGELRYTPVPLLAISEAGRLNPANGPYVLETLRTAVRHCQNGDADGLVTGPVHKGVINQSGTAFTGHTEFLAELTNAKQEVMMLATPGLRVALATTHLPLSDIPAAITSERLEAVIRVLNAELQQRFAIARPHILVCGLNPHAGEDGHLGHEEQQIIEPLLEHLRSDCGGGIDLEGPLPADTLFRPDNLQRADAVLAMYHDQGLPVLKHMGFKRAINITLGLPILRVSVDHGTALDLAGSGRADAASLRYAVDTAIAMATGNTPP